MNDTYRQIRNYARQLVAEYPEPAFYCVNESQVKASEAFFYSNEIIVDIHAFVSEVLEADFGHGLDHVTKVAKDAGAILLVEALKKKWNDTKLQNKLLLVQTAALLHDIKRKHKNHAQRSAEFAEGFLKGLPFSEANITEICDAIKNHEAFTCPVDESCTHSVISDCLYDADKFRWGPDNFTHTVWDMLAFADVPLASFLVHYPRGLDGINRIKSTFRTETGKKFGPQFIDIGLHVGERLLEIIKKEFTAEFKPPV